jgi:hypothetical protein
LPDKRPDAIVLMPIRAKREELLDGDDKKARLSVIILMLHTPSSYHLGANASRGRARFLCAMDEDPHQPSAQTIRPVTFRQVIPIAESAQIRPVSDPEPTTWKEESPLLPSK